MYRNHAGSLARLIGAVEEAAGSGPAKTWIGRSCPPHCAAMSSASNLKVTRTSTVTPDQIDELGHMNVRWYGHNAVEATKTLCSELGLGDPTLLNTYTRHHHEQLEGTNLEVRSALLGGASRLRFYHELRNQADDDLAATFIHELDEPGLEAPTTELPDYALPRSINLDTDGLAAAPSLSEARSRNLQIRLERDVTTEDTLDDDTVPPWLANNLIWGGERPDGDSDWIQTLPNGEQMAFATMESRLWVGELPRRGTRVQSFGAVIGLTDKILHDIAWSYDVESGKVLAVFESVDLAFNMARRRSMVMPDDIRARHAARLQLDLAPKL